MSKEYIVETCKEIITEYVDIDASKIEGKMNLVFDLGIDSFALMSVLMRIEDTFKIKIPNESLLSLSTVDDAVNYIYNAIN